MIILTKNRPRLKWKSLLLPYGEWYVCSHIAIPPKIKMTKPTISEITRPDTVPRLNIIAIICSCDEDSMNDLPDQRKT